MIETLARLLLRLSEAGEPAILWGRQVKPYLDRDVERLLARGVLTEQPPADEWDLCPDCECGLAARQIQCIEGNLIAACPLDRARDVRLDAHDLRSFRISAAALVDELATASGFTERPSEAVPGVWRLGKTPTNRRLFIALGRESVLTPGLIAALRATEPNLPITLIAPAAPAAELRRFTEAGVHFVTTVDAFAWAGPPFALDLRQLAPPASIEPRLTLFRGQSKIVLDGHELDLPPISFQLLLLLPAKVIAALFRNGVELGRGRAVSGAPVDDVTTFNLSVLTPLAANDVVDVRVHFASNDGYVESDQSHFWGHYVP